MDISRIVATVAALIVPQLDAGFAQQLSKDLDTAVSGATKNVGQKLGNSLSSVGSSLTKSVTAPVLAVGGAAIAAATTLDAAFDNLIAKTGASGEEARKLEASFKNVAKTSANDLGRISEVMADLSIRTGLSGTALEGLAGQVLDLERVTNQAADTDAITRFLAAYNIPAEQAGAALDKVFRASQKSGVDFNRLTGLVVQQSAAFSELGFTADETVALIAQFEATGVNTETVLAGLRANIIASTKGNADLAKVQDQLAKSQDAIEESTLKAQAAQLKYNEAVSKYGPGSSQALTAQAALVTQQNKLKQATQDAAAAQEVLRQNVKAAGGGIEGAGKFFQEGVRDIEALIAAGDETGAIDLAKKLFGGKTFTDSLDAIRRGKFDVQDYLKTIQGGKNTINGTAEETKDFSESLQELRNGLTISLGEAAIKLFPAFKSAVETVTPVLVGLLDKFNSLSPGVQELIVKGLALAAALGPVLSITGKLVTTVSGISKVAGPATKAFGGLKTAFTGLASIPPVAWGVILGVAAVVAIVVLIIKNWDKIKAAFIAVGNAIKTAWNATLGFLKNAVGAVVGFIKNNWDKLLIILTGPIGAAVVLIVKNWDRIKGAVSSVIDFIKNNWQTILAVLTGPIGLAVLFIKNNFETIKGAVSAALDFIGNVFRTGVEVIKSIWGTIVDAVSAPFDIAKRVVTEAIEIIKAALRGLKDVADAALGPIDEIIGGGAKIVGKTAGAIGSGLSAVGGFITGRASGGPVMGGRPYIVGERGPELIVPRGSGTVIPNNELGTLGGGITYNIEINNPRAEASSTTLPKALRRASQLRG